MEGWIKKIFLRTDKEVFSVLDQALLSFLSFVTNVLIARSCSKIELGLYALGYSLIIVATHFQTALISTPYMVYSPRLENHELREYAGSALIQQVTFSIVVSALLFASTKVFSLGMGPEGMAGVSQALALVIFFAMLKDFIRQLCFTSLKSKNVFFLDLWATIIQIGSLLLIAYFGIISARIAIVIVCLSCGLTSIGWLILNRPMFVMNFKKGFLQFKSHWRFARWVMASNILVTLANAVFPWFVAYFCGVAENGTWVACIGVATLGNFLLVGMQNTAGPRIVNAYIKSGVLKARRLVLKSMISLVLAMSGFFAIMIVAGERIVVLFYGGKYAENGLLVSLMSLNLVVSSAAFPFSRGLYAMERADVDFNINITGVFMMVLTIYLTYAFGLLGAACGTIASSFMSVLLRGIAFERIARVKMADMA